MSTTKFARAVSAREQHRRVTARKHVNSRVKTLSGAKPCVFSGNVAPRVTEVGSLFLRFPASIWESCGQKAHRTAARARFALEDAKKKLMVSDSEHFSKIRSEKLARDCSESLISQKIRHHVRRLRESWSISHDTPAMRACNWLQQNALTRLRAAKQLAMLRRSWQAAWSGIAAGCC